MMQFSGELHVHAFCTAFRRLIDPNRAIMTASSPYIVSSGFGQIDMRTIVSLSAGANAVDADVIHLEFTDGHEADGPANIVVAMQRGGVLVLRRTCALWLDPRDRPSLVASEGRKNATMTFDPDGMDSRPGAPARDLRNGYGRAASALNERAAAALAANDLDAIMRLGLAA